MERSVLHGLDEGQGRPALLSRTLLAHQQYGGCPVGDGRRIAGSDRSVGTECRLQRSESIERGIGPRAGVAGYAVERQNLLSEALARRHRVAVAGEGNLILARSRDAPLLARDLGVLAHREAGARLVERARIRSAQPLDAARDAGADTPVRDGLGDDRRGTQAGDAVRGNRLCLYMRRQARFEYDLAGKVGFMALGHDCTESNGVDPLRIDLVAIEEPAYGMFRERSGSDGRKRFAGFDERRARAGNNGDPVITHKLTPLHESHIGAPARNCRTASRWRGARPRNGSIRLHSGGWEA